MASAPAKTILMGEHAVVYGAPALVSAVDLRARAEVSPRSDVASGDLRLELPDLDHGEILPLRDALDYARRARERWEAYRRRPGRESMARVGGGRPGHVALVAIGEAERVAREARDSGFGEAHETDGPGLRLRVSSEIPVGRGFGSSAAVGAAVAGAWLAHRGVRRSREEMDDLLLEVERRQHGDPSGVDAATALRGGLVWAESGGDGLVFEEVADPAGALAGFHLADTGEPAEDTGEVVAAVRERRSRRPGEVDGAMEEIRRATLAFRRELDGSPPDVDRILRLVRRCQRGLEAIGVVPEPVRRLVRAVEEEGGAAKISGAGALTALEVGPPGGGVLLIAHPDPAAVARWSLPDGVRLLDVSLGTEGLRGEAAA